jgi:hypothetical protein
VKTCPNYDVKKRREHINHLHQAAQIALSNLFNDLFLDDETIVGCLKSIRNSADMYISILEAEQSNGE